MWFLGNANGLDTLPLSLPYPSSHRFYPILSYPLRTETPYQYSPRIRNRFIKWLRPKGLKMCSYVEKCTEFKNQTLKKLAGTKKCYVQRNTPGVGNISK